METVRRGIAAAVVGRRIEDAIVRERRLRLPVERFFCRNVRGRRVLNLRRRGKYLIFELDDGALIAHLGMSGGFYFSESPPAKKAHEHIGLRIGGRFLIYRDPRRFGCIVRCDAAPDSHALLKNLGPEPLSPQFGGAVLHRSLRGRGAPIKAALMDGKIVAGIGNIYASESLHLAKVRPQTAASRVSAARAETLAAAIKIILRRALRAGGSTHPRLRASRQNAGIFPNALESIRTRRRKMRLRRRH